MRIKDTEIDFGDISHLNNFQKTTVTGNLTTKNDIISYKKRGL